MKIFEKKDSQYYYDYRIIITENSSVDFSVNKLKKWSQEGLTIGITPYIAISLPNSKYDPRFSIGFMLVFVSVWFVVWKPKETIE